MKNLSEPQLESILKKVPQRSIPGGFSQKVLQQIQQQEEGMEIQFLKPLLLVANILFVVVGGWLGFSIISTLITNGFFEFFGLLVEQVFSRETQISTLFSVVLGLFPSVFILSFLVDAGFLFTGYRLYRKIRPITQGGVVCA